MDGPTCCLELVTRDAALNPACAQQSASAEQAIAAVVAAAREDLGCATNADCTIGTYATECSAGCNLVVNKTGAFELAQDTATVNGEQCDGFSSAGCSFSPISCPLLGNPTCVNGQCQVPGQSDDAGP